MNIVLTGTLCTVSNKDFVEILQRFCLYIAVPGKVDCVTFALGTFAPPYFGTFSPPILGHLLSLIPDICSPDICSQTFAPTYFGTFALRHLG